MLAWRSYKVGCACAAAKAAREIEARALAAAEAERQKAAAEAKAKRDAESRKREEAAAKVRQEIQAKVCSKFSLFLGLGSWVFYSIFLRTNLPFKFYTSRERLKGLRGEATAGLMFMHFLRPRNV